MFGAIYSHFSGKKYKIESLFFTVNKYLKEILLRPAEKMMNNYCQLRIKAARPQNSFVMRPSEDMQYDPSCTFYSLISLSYLPSLPPQCRANNTQN